MKAGGLVVRALGRVSSHALAPPRVSVLSCGWPSNVGYYSDQKRAFWKTSHRPEDPEPQTKAIAGFFVKGLPPLSKFYDFALNVDLFNDLHTPKVTVIGAGFSECNGTYRAVHEAHNDKILYRNPKGAVIYFDNGTWNMNMSSGTDSFVYSRACTGDHPPSGAWIGQDGDESFVEAASASCPGWSILTDTSKETTKTRYATTFVILGNNKKGKTWIMSQLSHCELPFNVQMHTPGICMKEFQLDGNQDLFRLIDSKGENTPLCEVSTERLKERTLEESFFREVTCEMADAFLYVVGDMGYDEQTTLNRLSEQLSSNKHTANQIIVIHNLKQVVTRAGLEARFQELQDIFCQQGFIVRQEGNLKFLQRGITGDHMAAVHLVLGCSTSEADMFDGCSLNELVFDKIRSLMRGLPKKALPLNKSFGDELAEVMTKKISRYYQSRKGISVTHRKEDAKMSLDHDGCWTDLNTLDVSLGNFIKIETGADPAYTISEKDGMRIVRVSMAGTPSEVYDRNRRAIAYDDHKEDGNVFIEIDMERLRPAFDGETFRTLAAPTHNVCKINVGKKTRKIEPDQDDLVDGVLTLRWELKGKHNQRLRDEASRVNGQGMQIATDRQLDHS